MLAIEEILCELNGSEMNEQGMPPGFRFHPTDEELITFYLASKVYNGTFCGVDIAEVDLNRCEPWELPDVAKMGEREWYFFSLRDRKYPTGLRTNRATGAGYWKATGKDREVYSSSSNGNTTSALLGMKKTLVFYKGRAPRGEKTKWVMHEYRLDGDFSCRHTCKEEWVICRIFQKLGEKKNGGVGQGQINYMQEASSNSVSRHLVDQSLKTLQPYQTLQSLHDQNQNQNLLMNQFHQDTHDLKSLINYNSSSSSLSSVMAAAALVASQANAFPTNNVLNSLQTPSSCLVPEKEDTNLLKTLLLPHHQDYYRINDDQESPPPFPKICKTESNFSQFHSSPCTNLQCQASTCANYDDVPKVKESPLCFGNLDNANKNVTGSSRGFPVYYGSDYDMSTLTSSSSRVLQAPLNRDGFKQMLLDPTSKITAGESWPVHF